MAIEAVRQPVRPVRRLVRNPVREPVRRPVRQPVRPVMSEIRNGISFKGTLKNYMPFRVPEGEETNYGKNKIIRD